MKKIIFALVAIAMAAGAFTFIACNKDSDKVNVETQQSTKNIEDSLLVVGDSEQGSLNIIPRIDKEEFLASLEVRLNEEEKGRNVAEDLKMWNEPYNEREYAPIMSVSFFDLKEDCGKTLFIRMETVEEGGLICYAVYPGSTHKNCTGKCNSGCFAQLDHTGKFLYCKPCQDPKPAFLTPEEERNFHMNHYCRTKESFSDNIFMVIFGLLLSIFD